MTLPFDLVKNYVDDKFELEVLKLIPKVERKSTTGVNQTLRWGKNTGPYRMMNISTEIPEVFHQFHKDFDFNMVGINEYYPGQRIDWHVDDAAGGEVIRVISLMSDAEIKFKNGGSLLSYALPRFSYSAFWGELRWGYQHSLMSPDYRVSIVFRNII